MRRIIMPIVALVLVGALASFWLTYTVSFSEAAVVTRWGEAGPGSVKVEPGLYFKIPMRNVVTKYDTRIRLVQARKEAQQTADDRQLVVEAFCTYRVVDPKQFFARFSSAGRRASDHFRQAEDEILRSNLRSAVGEVSGYRIDELFTTDASGSKIPELEDRILAVMTAPGPQGATIQDDFGIEITGVGISSIVFPQETSEAVFDRMRAERDRLVKEIEASGDAEAQEITSTAKSRAGIIQAFANSRADEIRAKGDVEAAAYLAEMNQNPELAVFLRAMDFLRDTMSRRTTLIFSSEWPGFDLFRPDAMKGLSPGDIPSVDIGLESDR